jgi:Xaa-Pro aminopeptidase
MNMGGEARRLPSRGFEPYIAAMPEIHAIPHAEHAARRKQVRTSLKKSLGVIFAGEQANEDDYAPHPHFHYLTGITDEPGAVLVLDPANPVEARQEMLFLRPLNPEAEKWDGYRLEISKALREKSGFKAIFRLNLLPRFLSECAARCKSLACLHPLAHFDQPVSPDLAIFRRIAERVPSVTIEDRARLLAEMRAVKSKREIALIQRAIDITAIGFETAMRAVRPGMNEFDLQEALEHAYRTNGARQTAFPAIVGSGINSTVLHYRANDQQIRDGDLVLIDSGAAFGSYRADITRTVPANGRFTDRQREVYEVVLRALNAAIKAVKPGVRIAHLDKVARQVINKAGFGDSFIHGIGHHLGLETHDVNPDEPLKAGAVLTIEPGIYIPQEKLGIRIEDDVLVTSAGSRVLSAKIPRSIDAIERLMGR